uniref:Gustatory receptor n=1 Tax=Plectus sambesii TaxID=2011161 RepID=A0A914XDJ4_9BILA
MKNSSELVCIAVNELFTNQTVMTIIFAIQAVSTLPTTLVGVFLAIAIGKTTSLHFNIRILLINLSISAVVTNCGIGIVAIYQLFAIFSATSEVHLCHLMALSRKSCRDLRILYNLGSLPPVIGLLFLAIERLIATVQYRTYEQKGRKIIGISLTAIQWLIVVVVQLYHNDNESEIVAPYCQSVLSNPQVTEYFVGVMLIIQLVSFMVFLLLVRSNKQKMASYRVNYEAHQLSIRYQLEENVKTTKLMIPISAANCAIFAFSLIVILFFTNSLTESVELTTAAARSVVLMAPWIELTVLSMPLFIVTFCCVSVVYSLPMRASVFRLLGLGDSGRSIRVAEAAVTENADAQNIYFRQLQDQWRRTEVSDAARQQSRA